MTRCRCSSGGHGGNHGSGDVTVHSTEAIRSNVDSAVDARITGNDLVCRSVLVKVVVRARPCRTGIVRSEEAGNTTSGTNYEDSRIRGSRCGHTEAHSASSSNATNQGETCAVVRRVK